MGVELKKATGSKMFRRLIKIFIKLLLVIFVLTIKGSSSDKIHDQEKVHLEKKIAMVESS